MAVIVEPMLHLPGHFKTYINRFISGMIENGSQNIKLLATCSDYCEFAGIITDHTNVELIALKPRHPFVATLLSAFALITNKTIKKSEKIIFLDYHFIAFCIVYPVIKLYFKDLIVTHPGSSINTAGYSIFKKIKCEANNFFAYIVGAIATKQVYHSSSIRDKYYHPVLRSTKQCTVGWGVVKCIDPYPINKNMQSIASGVINIVSFGKVEKRKGLDQFLKWLDNANLEQQYLINIDILGKIDERYINEITCTINICQNISVEINNSYFSEDDLKSKLHSAHFALLVYDKTFTAASGVLADIIGYGIPTLTFNECYFSNDILRDGIGYSVNYDSQNAEEINRFVKFYKENKWQDNIRPLCDHTWASVATRYLCL